MIKINRTITWTVLITLILGIMIGRWITPPSDHSVPTDVEISTPATEWWTCSMHPQIRQHEPGKCPLCGMDLIPVGEQVEEENPLEIHMSPTAMQLANVQTMVIQRGSAQKEIRIIGKAQADERKMYSQVTHLEGRVESLAINFTGEEIVKGEILASIYSPALVAAQQELFTAYSLHNSQPELYAAAREKLKNWKISDAQIDAILEKGKPQESFPITADVSGIVMGKKVNLGDYVMRGMPMYDIVDLSQIWVLFDIYEQDLHLVRVGSPVEFTFQALPGQTFSSCITFIDPVIDPVTRSAKARVELANVGGKLKPEMFATGLMRLPVGSAKDQIVIPASAVLWTGERSLVYVKNPEMEMPTFGMHEITLGPSLGESYLVNEGLQPGMEIVVHGTFAIDAAAQLAGKPSMMNPQLPVKTTATDTVSHPFQTPVAFQNAIRALLDDYLILKDDLVSGDGDQALAMITKLLAKVEQLPVDRLEGDARSYAARQTQALKDILVRMQKESGLDSLRDHFKPLSAHMIAVVTAFGPFEKTVYVQHCPMADHNQGADWLSLQKNIRNPYFGDAMLTCGTTTRVIE